MGGVEGSYAYLGRLKAHTCPLGGGKVHGLRDAVAAAHFGHKGSWEADNELATLLHGPVHLDPLFAQHLRGDLGRQAGADMHSLRHSPDQCLAPTAHHCPWGPFCESLENQCPTHSGVLTCTPVLQVGHQDSRGHEETD